MSNLEYDPKLNWTKRFLMEKLKTISHEHLLECISAAIVYYENNFDKCRKCGKVFRSHPERIVMTCTECNKKYYDDKTNGGNKNGSKE
jgi:hypothetical protein